MFNNQLSRKKKKKSLTSSVCYFHSVNTFTMADFNYQPVVIEMLSGKIMHVIGSLKLVWANCSQPVILVPFL